MKTRREAIQSSLVIGAGSLLTFGQTKPASGKQDEEETVDNDTASVMAAGMTEEEALCWKKTAECAAAFFALPELHPMDDHEVASAIHVIQNKLLSRPTYRKYVEEAKARLGDD